MSLREKKKQKTNDRLRAAIKRIVAKVPQSKKLQGKLKEGKLKLNPTNVDIEAANGYGTIKNHPDVLQLINDINNTNPANVEGSSEELQKLKERLDKATSALKEAKAALEEKNAEIELLKSVNEILHAHCRELTSALFEHIPQEKREELFKE